MNKLRSLLTFDDVNQPYDKLLLVIVLVLMCIGLVIVASASIPEGIAISSDPFRFLKRQVIYVFICLFIMAAIVNVPFDFWYKRQALILTLSLTALLAVLLVGAEVNGSLRWLRLGPINVQPSEFAKLAIVLFLASYLVRRQEEVVDTIKGFIKPLIILSLFSILLLLQPDLGSTVVIVVVMMGMLFIANAKLVNFIAIIVSLLAVIVALVVMSPYRMARVVGFLDPWADPFGRSYQLTQSLMAFGRGGWFGQGLGNSVQKLKYLPEAHTDFIMAILAEELGFIGVSVVITLEFILVYRAFSVGKKALALKTPLVFPGYVAIGIAIWFFFQTAVNIGAASGIAPTKGLTLPLVSYGGSSLISIAIAVALLLRIDFERRIAASPIRLKKSAAKKKKSETPKDARKDEKE